MAYLAFQDVGGAAALRATIATATPAVPAERLSALEWTVVALARRDGRGSLRPASRLTKAIRALLRQRNPRLADDRLEALRRMAVLSWQDGYAVASREVRAFLDAGFSAGQYETLVDYVSAARVLPPRTVVA